jgi:hypothetical protein
VNLSNALTSAAGLALNDDLAIATDLRWVVSNCLAYLTASNTALPLAFEERMK